jgi:hypothetical protein
VKFGNIKILSNFYDLHEDMIICYKCRVAIAANKGALSNHILHECSHRTDPFQDLAEHVEGLQRDIMNRLDDLEKKIKGLASR